MEYHHSVIKQECSGYLTHTRNEVYTLYNSYIVNKACNAYATVHTCMCYSDG